MACLNLSVKYQIVALIALFLGRMRNDEKSRPRKIGPHTYAIRLRCAAQHQ